MTACHRFDPARGGGGARPVQRPAAAGGASSARRGIIEPPTENATEETPHGKRATKKEVGAAAGRVYLFFRVILPGRVLDYSPGLLSSPSGGVNPSRAILSRVAVKMYPCTLSPI